MKLNKEIVEEIIQFCNKEIPSAIDNPRFRSAVQIFLLASILQEIKILNKKLEEDG